MLQYLYLQMLQTKQLLQVKGIHLAPCFVGTRLERWTLNRVKLLRMFRLKSVVSFKRSVGTALKQTDAEIEKLLQNWNLLFYFSWLINWSCVKSKMIMGKKKKKTRISVDQNVGKGEILLRGHCKIGNQFVLQRQLLPTVKATLQYKDIGLFVLNGAPT